jgi:hypothetical protein
MNWLTHRHREQAHSYKGFVPTCQIADTKKPQWAKPMQFWLKRSIVR